jgi:predicted transcriptional regulator
MRYSSVVVTKARKLSGEGLTYREISRILGVSNSNIAIWCRGHLNKDPRKIISNLEQSRELIRKTDCEIFKRLPPTTELNKLCCALIYGCEGAKYPATNCVALTNSEPKLVKTFISLFRQSFKVDEKKFKAYLQIHDNFNYNETLLYWSNLLDIPKNSFYKPIVTKAGGKKHRQGYMGTCTLKYYDYKLQLRLIGIYEEYMRKSIFKEESDSGPFQGLAKPRPQGLVSSNLTSSAI